MTETFKPEIGDRVIRVGPPWPAFSGYIASTGVNEVQLIADTHLEKWASIRSEGHTVAALLDLTSVPTLLLVRGLLGWSWTPRRQRREAMPGDRISYHPEGLTAENDYALRFPYAYELVLVAPSKSPIGWEAVEITNPPRPVNPRFPQPEGLTWVEARHVALALAGQPGWKWTPAAYPRES